MIEERFTLFADGEEYGDYFGIGPAKCGKAQAMKRPFYRQKNPVWTIEKRTMTILREEVVWSSDD